MEKKKIYMQKDEEILIIHGGGKTERNNYDATNLKSKL